MEATTARVAVRQGAAQKAPKPSGTAWPTLQGDIDKRVTALIAHHDLPGVTVAASKHGRLVVSRGYGHADTAKRIALGDDVQIHMGSNSKVMITAQATHRAMKAAGLDPATTRLYGPKGVLGTAFDRDIAIGSAAKGTPIAWYHRITVQHLLDHTSGFRGSGDEKGASELFGTPVGKLTYAQVHRHVLQTRALGTEPGATYTYTNHGFGSLTLVVEKLTGRPFVDYAAQQHLRPRGLDGAIEPNWAPRRSSTAAPHQYVNGKPVPFTPSHSNHLGAAAGGYRGSSRTLVRLMIQLAKEFSPGELDRLGWRSSGVTPAMAWGDGTTADLSHGGRIAGGTSHVRMTVDGINVAVMTNIWMHENGQLGELASAIVGALRSTEIPSHYDLGKNCTLPAIKSGHAQVARHGIPEGRYQCDVDQLVGAGYRPRWIAAFDVNGIVQFNAVFVPDKAGRWRAFHGLTGDQYQALFGEMVADGYRPAQVDSYVSRRGVRYVGRFEKVSGGPFQAYHGLTADAHQKRFDELTGKGFRPTSLSVVSVADSLRYTAIYERGLAGSFVVRSQLTPTQYQDAFDAQKGEGRRPVYLNGYTHKGSARLVAIFGSAPKKDVRARHGLTPTQYQAEWESATAAGFQTEVVTGYGDGSSARYAAVWTR